MRFLYKEEANEPLQIATTLEKYLYEPNSSLLKSGCFKRLSTLYGVKKLDINSHLYTSEKLMEDFPGRVFQVEQSSTMINSQFLYVCACTDCMLSTIYFPVL